MRRQEQLLRSIIREMAWAGHLGVVKPEDTDESKEGATGTFAEPFLMAGVDLRAAEKYALSDKFAELAKKYFSKLPFKVWTAPVIGAELSDVMTNAMGGSINRRSLRVPLDPEGLEILSQTGFPGLDRIDPQQDLVIMYSTSKMKAFDTGPDQPKIMRLATPWMICHTVFDVDPNELDSIISPLYQWWRSQITTSLKAFSEITNKRFDIFTMKSSRTRQLGRTDIISEIATQELLTSGGFEYNVPEGLSQEAQAMLEELNEKVKAFGDAWRSIKTDGAHAARGNLFVVRTLG